MPVLLRLQSISICKYEMKAKILIYEFWYLPSVRKPKPNLFSVQQKQ